MADPNVRTPDDALESGTPAEAAVALARVLKVTEAAYERIGHLQRALESRIVIEQAKGVLAERLEVDVETAFEVLRRGARSSRMKLRDVAAAVVSEPETPQPITEALRSV